MIRTRLAVFSLVVAGTCFFAYPVSRPYTNESALAGAGAFTSLAWLLSHTLAMVGLILLVLGLFGPYGRFRETKAEKTGIPAFVLTWVGVGLILPYYGAETFGFNAIGREAIERNSAEPLLMLTGAVRFGEGVWLLRQAEPSSGLRSGAQASPPGGTAPRSRSSPHSSSRPR